MTKIFVEGAFEVVAQAKGNRLIAKQPIIVEFQITDPALSSEKAFFASIDTAIRQAAVAVVIGQIRQDIDLRRRIGGTKWSVEPTNEAIEFPIFLRREEVGHIEKFLNPNPYRLLEQIISRNQHIFAELQAEIATTV